MTLETRPPETANGKAGYISFTGKNRENVVAEYNTARINHTQRTTASSDSVRMRSGYDPGDYYDNRPGDQIPVMFKDVVHACRMAYLKVGVVRNVIDMMTDFASEGLRFVHSDKNVEAFFKVWMAKVNIDEAVDEFVRHILVDGNVVVKRGLAKLSKPVEEQWTSKTLAKNEIALAAEEPIKLYKDNKVQSRVIPWRYNFLNVGALYWMGGDEARIKGERKLGFRVSDSILTKIKTPNEVFQKGIFNSLPAGVSSTSIDNDGGIIPLDMDSIYIAHNKKDSWEDWAPPFLYPIISEIHFKDKLRQMELSAMDGCINVIRLWKLGDHKEGLLPSEANVNKVIEILETNTGGGAIDIVWDSMIDMKDYYPPIDKILGTEKFTQVNKDILIGLGVPEVLIGGEGANFSNSWIQLKTLTEKLGYIRDKLKDWLYGEVQIVCEAMDISVTPKIRFNENNLDDENTNKKLIVGLLDRGVLSVEAVLQAYGEDFLMEIERIRGEKKLFKSAGIEPVSPIQPPPEPGLNQPSAKKPNGRPPASKDSSKRATRTPKVRTKGSNELTVFAMDAISAIDEYIIPEYTRWLGVSNARKLTNEQREEINEVRVLVLSTIQDGDDLSQDNLLDKLEASGKANSQIVKLINKELASFAFNHGNPPTLSQRKTIEAVTWANYHEENNGEI